MILPVRAYPSMNVSHLLVQLFKPAQAARVAAQARIANAPGCERAPIAALLQCVNNAGTLRGDVSICKAAQRLDAHIDERNKLTPAQIINQVRAVKHEQRTILRDLMQRSAGARPGSGRAQEIAATRAALESARQFNWNLRVAASAAKTANA